MPVDRSAAAELPRTSRKPSQADVWCVLLLLLIPCIVFSNTLHNAYHLDDFGRIADNPEIDQVSPVWRHFVDPRTSSSVPTIVQYRPMLPLSLSINAALADALGVERLTAFHVGNILIHLLSGLLLYGLLRELLAHWSPWPPSVGQQREIAFVAALAFALHPVSGVPVNYLAARDLLLMEVFLMASLWAYVRMRRRGQTALRWASVVLLLALSLLSKTNAVAAPLLILFFELLPGGQSLGSLSLWKRVAPFAALSVSFFAFTKLALGFSDAGMLMVERPSLEYPLTQAKVHLFYYLRNFLWPFQMRPLPLIEPVRSIFNLQAWSGAIVILGSLWIAWKLRRRMAVASFAIMAYWILFSPTSSLLPFRMLAADYRQYPSLPFLCLALALALSALPKPFARRLAAAAFLSYLAVCSLIMNRVWESERSLWAHSVRYGATGMAHHNYARSLAGSNDRLAEKHYREALRQNPENVRSHIGLGLLQIRQGNPEEGLKQVRQAVQLAPDWAITHYWLARTLSMLGRTKEAAQESLKAAELDPRNLEHLHQAALDAQAAGLYAESLQVLQKLHAQRASYKQSLFLQGFALQMLHRNEEALDSYRSFLREHPDHVQVRFNLAYALMKTSRFEEAAKEFERTLELDPGYREAHLHLATCYRALGRGEEAARQMTLYRAGVGDGS